jgi:tRNA-Thr(GGU) m(6)t(6)A37 methyltransferase TsaA
MNVFSTPFADDDALSFTPIGVILTPWNTKYDAPRQPRTDGESKTFIRREAGDAIIRLKPRRNYEQALQDLEGFDRLWTLFAFHRNRAANGEYHWKPKVLPPRGRTKRGVFATRAPYRPNAIGMSVLSIKAIRGLEILVGDCDILDGSPVLDIKPYIPSYDSFPISRVGWLEEWTEDTTPAFECVVLPQAEEAFRAAQSEHPTFEQTLFQTLANDPFPHPYRRIKRLLPPGRVEEATERADNAGFHAERYEYAYRLWRIEYETQTAERRVVIDKIYRASPEKPVKDDHERV